MKKVIINKKVVNNKKVVSNNKVVNNKKVVNNRKVVNNKVVNNKVVNNKVVNNKVVNNKVVSNKVVSNNKVVNNDKVVNNYFLSQEYFDKINDFNNIYNTSKNDIINNDKIGFRYFCYKFINNIKQIELPEIKLDNNYEAVLIEYRCFPHLEFLIRNMILKLGENWSHTIICGNLNYDFIVNMCKVISENIKIIKTDYDNLNQNSYSEFLSSINFWNLFTGEKILIYQEDSCIFKNNINDFLEYDYIGAPWPKTQNDNEYGVGNGGFSLRTKKIMLEIINKISIKDTIFNSSTINYMKGNKLSVHPEDVYFSLNMIKYNIGKVAPWEIAKKFSIETIYDSDSLGGHNFWLCDKDWKEHILNKLIVNFKINYDMSLLEHRGGWKVILYELINNIFYNNNSNYIFFDMLEKNFLWKANYYCDKKWAGIIHCTQNTPPYLSSCNISNFFNNTNFIKSLNNCKCIITLSTYVANYLKDKIKSINNNIVFITLKHPVIFDNSILKFNINNYINNNNKYIIQIGQQLRKVTSIYNINISNHKKIWLTGTKNFNHCHNLLNNEQKYLKKNINIKNVEMKYTNTFEEYDDLLSKNIVFIELFDAAANNTILECIVRNTPIIVNKLPGVVEYLGENYPLYYNNLNEIQELIKIENISKACEYLKNMNKDDIQINYFIKQLFTELYKIFN